MNFSSEDLAQMSAKGISSKTVERQLAIFAKGDSFIEIVNPATIGNGILRPDDERVECLLDFAQNKSVNYNLLKFVPASGAATRMFKSLYNTLETNKSDKETEIFIEKISLFAFFHELEHAAIENGMNLEHLLSEGKTNDVIDLLLNKMEYGQLPKGLLSFHKYHSFTRTAVEEHLAEGAQYARNDNGTVRIHLTVSPEHSSRFEKKVKESIPFFEGEYNVKYEFSWSIQKPSTDTVAANENNEPFRNKDGSLVFRPGGHGALIENLNELDADFVFIKNIDNVVPDPLRASTNKYKRLLLGEIIELKEQIDKFLTLTEQGSNKETNAQIVSFFNDRFFIRIEDKNKDNISFLRALLNRPIRVCGMVKNEGEPGGGPFFVKEKDGSVSLQIVESSQINLKDSNQKAIFSQATHFNPVDLLCSIKDYKGRKFDLKSFVDPETGFISEKSKDGKPLKAYELPGLWNGAMAKWNTVFLEVPIETFNPVKTINDLLREEHICC